MANISKITVPSGNTTVTYDIKDAVIRAATAPVYSGSGSITVAKYGLVWYLDHLYKVNTGGTYTSWSGTGGLSDNVDELDGSPSISSNIIDIYNELTSSIANPMHYIGASSTPITDGGSEIPTIAGMPSYTPSAGDIVTYQSSEFIWQKNNTWAELGNTSSLGDLANYNNVKYDKATKVTYDKTKTVAYDKTTSVTYDKATGISGSYSKTTGTQKYFTFTQGGIGTSGSTGDVVTGVSISNTQFVTGYSNLSKDDFATGLKLASGATADTGTSTKTDVVTGYDTTNAKAKAVTDVSVNKYRAETSSVNGVVTINTVGAGTTWYTLSSNTNVPVYSAGVDANENLTLSAVSLVSCTVGQTTNEYVTGFTQDASAGTLFGGTLTVTKTVDFLTGLGTVSTVKAYTNIVLDTDKAVTGLGSPSTSAPTLTVSKAPFTKPSLESSTTGGSGSFGYISSLGTESASISAGSVTHTATAATLGHTSTNGTITTESTDTNTISYTSTFATKTMDLPS